MSAMTWQILIDIYSRERYKFFRAVEFLLKSASKGIAFHWLMPSNDIFRSILGIRGKTYFSKYTKKQLNKC